MKVPDHELLIQMNKTVNEVLSIELIPGKFSDPHMTKFNWTLIKFTSSELLI